MGDFNIAVDPDRGGVRVTVDGGGDRIVGTLDRNRTAALVQILCRTAGLPEPWKKG